MSANRISANAIKTGFDRSIPSRRFAVDAGSAMVISGYVCTVSHQSHAENLDVSCLDLLAVLEHRHRIILHHLDLAERRTAGMLLDIRMHRSQPADVNAQLLAFRREAEALEQARCVRVWRRLEQAI